MPHRTVVAGDCVASLALEAGLLPDTIWDHQENADLRRLRKDPNILLPGDRIFIPDIRETEVSRPTDERHEFVRRGVPARFRLRLLRNDEPRKGLTYTLVIDGESLEGTTDGDGWIDHPIPPDARNGVLTLTGTGEEIPVHFGRLDPVDEVVGIQQRLRNLGYYDGPCIGDFDDDTVEALTRFQEQNGLPADGDPDAATRQALTGAHGS